MFEPKFTDLKLTEATETTPASATLWVITSPSKEQRYPLITTSNPYEMALLSQLNDTLEEARKMFATP